MATIRKHVADAKRELTLEGALPDDPEAAAEAIARRVRQNTEHLANPPSTRGVQREAADAAGAPRPLTASQEQQILEEDADARTPAGRARRAAGSTRGARTTAGRAARRASRAPGEALRGATSPRGVVVQMFGLVFLYWILRAASSGGGESFLTNVVAGLRRPFEWLFATRGVATSTAGAATITPGPPNEELADKQAQAGAQAGAGVERWRPLVAKHFPPGEVAKALRVIHCESRGNPDARNPDSDASGLFQHLPRFWPQRSQAAGYAGASIFDPEANVATAAWLLRTGGWGHWPNCGKL